MILIVLLKVLAFVCPWVCTCPVPAQVLPFCVGIPSSGLYGHLCFGTNEHPGVSLWMGDVSAHIWLCLSSLQSYTRAVSCMWVGRLILFCVLNPAHLPSNNSRSLAFAAGIKMDPSKARAETGGGDDLCHHLLRNQRHTFGCSGGTEGLILPAVRQIAAIIHMPGQKVHHTPVPVGFLGTWSCKVNTQWEKGRVFVLKEGP